MKTTRYLAFLSLFALLMGSTAVLADCRTNIWQNYHQYFTKGTVNTVSFKLVNISYTNVWLHCVSGKPEATWSNNAVCKKLRESNHGKTLSYRCRYVESNHAPCIQMVIKCR